MTHIQYQNAPLSGNLLANGAPQQESNGLRPGDTVFFDGTSFLVLASGRMALGDGAVEVTHVQAGTSPQEAALTLDLPPAFAAKAAEELGIEPGARVSLRKEQVERMNQAIVDYGNLMAGVDFASRLAPADALATSSLDSSDPV